MAFLIKRGNWTLVSEHPEQSAKGSLLLLVLHPENVLFSCWGRPVPGPLPGTPCPAEGRRLGEGFFQDLPCAASDFGGFSSPDLTHPGSDSNLRQHFVLISCRGGEAASGGPSGAVGGPLLGTVMSSPPFYQGPWRASQRETADF